MVPIRPTRVSTTGYGWVAASCTITLVVSCKLLLLLLLLVLVVLRHPRACPLMSFAEPSFFFCYCCTLKLIWKL
jgi:hypothetical protein